MARFRAVTFYRRVDTRGFAPRRRARRSGRARAGKGSRKRALEEPPRDAGALNSSCSTRLFFQGEYPAHQGLDVAVGDLWVGRHRHRAPNAGTARLDLLTQLGQRSGIAFVLRGDVLIRGTNDL